MTTDTTQLKRAIGLPALVFYGVGTMVGGGFYALLGEVAGDAGHLAPLALLASGLLALLNGLAFAELGARFPVSAGEARYVSEGLGRPWLATLTAWMVIATGVVSAATLAVATVGFLGDLVPVPERPALVLVVLLLGLIAAWGVVESVGVVVVITAIEVGTLLVVFALNARHLGELPETWAGAAAAPDASLAFGVFSAAFLAFYAFIGFEDMVNMAEEVREPRRTLPRAILLSVVITTVLYVGVSMAAVVAVDPAVLERSETPIAELVRGRGEAARVGIGLVSLLTGVNGALVQIVMASRVAYGAAGQGSAPRWLGRVDHRTQTPLLATAVMTGVVLLLALFFPLRVLAETTSGIILGVFALVNLALWRVKGSRPDAEGVSLRVPRWVALVGCSSCLLVLAVQISTVLTTG